MNTYHAFFKGKEIELEAPPTSFAAQRDAAARFKARKPWEVTVVLVALEGAPMIHNSAILPGA